MMERILAAIGIGSVAVSSAADKELVGSYKDHSPNLIYHLLFCDRLKLFEDNHQGELNDPWAILFKADPDYDAVAKIAKDKSQESRVRMLAFGLLRSAKKVVPQKELLGTIIEVRMPGGLDTLDGAIVIFGLAPFRKGAYEATITVVEGTPALSGIPQRLEGRYLLCGLERLPATIATVAGLGVTGMGAIWRRLFFGCTQAEEASPRRTIRL